MKLLITGGHLAPALAFIDDLKESTYKDNQLIFVGRKYNNEFEKTLSLEYKEVEKLGIPFFHIKTGRFTRAFSWRMAQNLCFIPLGFWQAFTILRKEKPDVIVSFGSYIAVPVAVVGGFMGITVYTHEQTIHPGLANQIIGFFARCIFISFEHSQSYFAKEKTLFTGNPVRKQIFHIIKKPFLVEKTKPVIYITGGSLGSHSINMHIEKLLPTLLEQFIIIHQSGDVKEFNDNERLTKLRETLPEQLKSRYFLQSHFYVDEIGYIYSIADIVISRAGANTFFELATLHKPTIFIPLPWSGYQEQQKQAELFKQAGVGEIFDQSDDSSKLLAVIKHMNDHLEEYKQHFSHFTLYSSTNATQIIRDTIFKPLLQKGESTKG
jgi:UDP-N-acetylglucosamine--N-acetylmuramyl-(pentapeptide) pyrophosphoryl-undecaprenol N-acetylglucosamine transferase